MNKINLDMEQERIVQEILYGQAKATVVAGGPGTGKSLLAKKAYDHLFQKYGKEGTLYLVYNKPLSMSLNVDTKDSWLYRQFRISYKGSDKEREQKLESALQRHYTPKYEYIIVDEAQDFSLNEILLLQKCAKHLICFIDPNQAYTGNKTTIALLLFVLGIEAPYYLTKNYRNTQEIFEAASLFLDNEQNELRPSRFVENGDKPIRFSVSNYQEENDLIADIISECIPSDTMFNEGKAEWYDPCSPHCSIGILAPNQKSVSALYNGIRDSLERKGYVWGEPGRILQKYSSSDNRKGEQEEIDFNPDPEEEGKCTIIGYNVAKGLEFDVVIMPRITQINTPPFVGNEKEQRNHLLYTAMTRARKNLFLIDWPSDSAKFFNEINKIRTSSLFRKG